MGNRCQGCDYHDDRSVDKKSIPKYIPQISRGLVVHVYDGDTIHVVGRVKYNPELFKFSVRLNGLDCPEMTSKDPEEREMAIKAKTYIQDRLEHKYVVLQHVKLDKYGRLLAYVMLDGKSINQELINKRLAAEYDGGTKKSPASWKTYYGDNEP